MGACPARGGDEHGVCNGVEWRTLVEQTGGALAGCSADVPEDARGGAVVPQEQEAVTTAVRAGLGRRCAR